ncbi:MAG: flagellar biosynthetic protein FliQ [Myxococcales bacterium]|nr:flagellar biosynthetic protein FliQ [Myxococcales bacterium]MDD9965687.1 flagellar biosynthetic protein FliQ [Myxococcales bacterium]
MTSAFALDWFRELLWRAVLTASPPILAVVVVGLIVAIIQATTSVNDQAVAFGPKGLAAVVALSVSGPWVIKQLSEFTILAFSALSRVGP